MIIPDYDSMRLYISRTGNTRLLAEVISELLKAPVLVLAHAISSLDVNDFDLLVTYPPVIGLGPAWEILAFVRHLAECSGKRAIRF